VRVADGAGDPRDLALLAVVDEERSGRLLDVLDGQVGAAGCHPHDARRLEGEQAVLAPVQDLHGDLKACRDADAQQGRRVPALAVRLDQHVAVEHQAVAPHELRTMRPLHPHAAPPSMSAQQM